MFWNRESLKEELRHEIKAEYRNYTEAVLLRQLRESSGNEDDADPTCTSAAQIAASFLGRCMSLAEVTPEGAASFITPKTLYDIGSDLIFAGESLFLIDVSGEKIRRLIRASQWDVVGDATTWRYKLTLSGPTGDRTKSVDQSEVFHPRINTSASQPHKGKSPVELAGFTASALANMERSTSDEASGPTGQVLPAPIDSIGDDNLEELQSDVTSLKGKTLLVQSMTTGFGDGRASAPNGDWTSRRIGPDPPEGIIKLREQTHDAVLASCGLSPVLFSKGTDASASREALRQFLHSTLQPIGDLVALEAREKIHPETRFGFDKLFGADVQGRARAAKSLVDAGFSVDDAARMTGFNMEA